MSLFIDLENARSHFRDNLRKVNNAKSLESLPHEEFFPNSILATLCEPFLNNRIYEVQKKVNFKRVSNYPTDREVSLIEF